MCRGGFNAKSTILQLLMTTLGDYAVKADANVIYKSDKVRHASEHNAGLLAFEKVRLMVIEETDPSKCLDQGKDCSNLSCKSLTAWLSV